MNEMQYLMAMVRSISDETNLEMKKIQNPVINEIIGYIEPAPVYQTFPDGTQTLVGYASFICNHRPSTKTANPDIVVGANQAEVMSIINENASRNCVVVPLKIKAIKEQMNFHYGSLTNTSLTTVSEIDYKSPMVIAADIMGRCLTDFFTMSQYLVHSGQDIFYGVDSFTGTSGTVIRDADMFNFDCGMYIKMKTYEVDNVSLDIVSYTYEFGYQLQLLRSAKDDKFYSDRYTN